jgi:hypothetical protein
MGFEKIDFVCALLAENVRSVTISRSDVNKSLKTL